MADDLEKQIEVVRYSDKYKEQVKEFISDVYDKERGHPQFNRSDLGEIKETYQINGGNFWVAVDGGKVVGTIGLRNQGDERASMHRFAVAKIFRGKGVGARLFSALLGFAKNHDYKKMFLGTTTDAIAAINFYERNEFKQIESLPEDLAQLPYFVGDTLFYELDLENYKK